jgi:hypothetical protein
MKIETITKEQESLMPTYVQKWIKISTSTENVDEQTTAEIVNKFRALIDRQSAPLLIVDNPIEAWVVCCLHEQKVPFDKLIETMKSVFQGNRDYDIPKASLPFNDIGLCGTFSFYDYMINVLGVKLSPELLEKYKVWEATSKLCAIYPMEGLSVVCKKPLEIHLNERNVLHKDGGAALAFGGEGDFKIFALNGVLVPEWLAVTDSHKIDIEKYNEIINADVKAEFVRKVGIEQFLSKGTKLDSYENYNQEDHTWWWNSEYELWDMKSLFPNLDSAPFLKMRNPTTKIWHMEGVSPKCQKLTDALKERFGGRDMKIIAAA